MFGWYWEISGACMQGDCLKCIEFVLWDAIKLSNHVFDFQSSSYVACYLYPKSSSPEITRSRQFEEPRNKHSTLDWQLASCSGSCSWTSGESKHGDPRSCNGSFLAFGGLWSASKDFSGLAKLGKSPWFDRSKRLFGQSRVIWSFSPQLKHCFPTGHSALMWLMLPQLKQRRWGFWGQLCSPLTMWPLHQRHSIRVWPICQSFIFMPEFYFYVLLTMTHLDCRR